MRLTVPSIPGTGVLLRPFRTSDVDAVLEASDDPLIPLITTIPHPAAPDSAVAYLERQHERAAQGTGSSLAIDVDGVCVGQIGLWPRNLDRGRASIGYWIRPTARRRGYAADALTTLVEWAQSLPEIERLELYVEPRNLGSQRTAERAGFEREGLLRSWELVGDERRDMYMYSRVRSSRRDARASSA